MNSSKRIEFTLNELRAMSTAMACLPEARHYEGRMHRELCLALSDKLFRRVSDAGARAFMGGTNRHTMQISTVEASVLTIGLTNAQPRKDEGWASALQKVQPMLIAATPKPR